MKAPVIKHTDKFHVSFWHEAPAGLPYSQVLVNVSHYTSADGAQIWNAHFTDGGYDRARRILGNEYAGDLLDLAVKAGLILTPEIITVTRELLPTGCTGATQERELARCAMRDSFSDYVERRRAAA